MSLRYSAFFLTSPLIMETPVLDGYTTLLVDGQKFLVPDFAVDEVKMRLAGDIKRKVMGAENMTEKVRAAIILTALFNSS